MAKTKIKRIIRRLTDEERARHAQVRADVVLDNPPLKKKRRPVRKGIGADLRRSRKAQGLTYYAVAKRAGIPNPNTVKEVEYGSDGRLSSIEAIATALGLKLAVIKT